MNPISINDGTYRKLERFKAKTESWDEFFDRTLLPDVDEDDEGDGRSKKVILLGREWVGKTSIRKYFFENFSPRQTRELEPTRGRDFHSYKVFDLFIGIADLAGQEIDRWLGAEIEETFLDVDYIIYVFDITKYSKSKDNLISDIAKIIDGKIMLCPQAHVAILGHKTDILKPSERVEIYNDIETGLKRLFKEKEFDEGVDVHFTSIMDGTNHTIDRVFLGIIHHESVVLQGMG